MASERTAGEDTSRPQSAEAGRQSWDPDRYARVARFVADLGMPVVELLAPKPGERILDLGCGDGALTKKLADMGVQVVGVDASAEQIAAAQRLGLDARVVDAENLHLPPAYLSSRVPLVTAAAA